MESIYDEVVALAQKHGIETRIGKNVTYPNHRTDNILNYYNITQHCSNAEIVSDLAYLLQVLQDSEESKRIIDRTYISITNPDKTTSRIPPELAIQLAMENLM